MIQAWKLSWVTRRKIQEEILQEEKLKAPRGTCPPEITQLISGRAERKTQDS